MVAVASWGYIGLLVAGAIGLLATVCGLVLGARVRDRDRWGKVMVTAGLIALIVGHLLAGFRLSEALGVTAFGAVAGLCAYTSGRWYQRGDAVRARSMQRRERRALASGAQRQGAGSHGH